MWVKQSLIVTAVLYFFGALAMSHRSDELELTISCLDAKSEKEFYYCTGRGDLYYDGSSK